MIIFFSPSFYNSLIQDWLQGKLGITLWHVVLYFLEFIWVNNHRDCQLVGNISSVQAFTLSKAHLGDVLWLHSRLVNVEAMWKYGIYLQISQL